MKYKNYRNSYTNEDIIYSRKNIADMSVREAFSRIRIGYWLPIGFHTRSIPSVLERLEILK